MRAKPGIEGFFAANDQMALGIAQAVRNAGKQGDIAIVGVDGIEDALKAIERGAHVGDRLAVPVHDRAARRGGMPRRRPGHAAPGRH